MESTLCMPYMLREMKLLSGGHPVAESMLLFSFAYMVEGAAGFGTPAALGAPMLASLGYAKLDAVVLLLMFNTFATVWGAVGTPIWFGFGPLNLPEEDYIDISYKAGVALFLSGLILLPTLALRVICPWHVLKQSLIFIFLSFVCCAGLSLGLSFASYEFPSLVGGIVGCFATAVLITFRVGLAEFTPEVTEDSIDAEIAIKPKIHQSDEEVSEEERMSSTSVEDTRDVSKQKSTSDTEEDEEESHEDRHAAAEALLGPRKSFSEGYIFETAGRTFPLWGTVLILMLTRIEQIGLKEILNRKEPSFEIDLGSYGTFRMSASLVLQLNNILSYPNMVRPINSLFLHGYIPRRSFLTFPRLFLASEELEVCPAIHSLHSPVCFHFRNHHGLLSQRPSNETTSYPLKDTQSPSQACHRLVWRPFLGQTLAQRRGSSASFFYWYYSFRFVQRGLYCHFVLCGHAR